MKTAMQLLIDKMKQELLYLDNNDATSILLTATIRLASELMSVEKNQITDAYYDGLISYDHHWKKFDYYNSKFKNESEKKIEEEKF